MYSLKKKFGLRVKELRKALKMTQDQLAEKMNMDTPNLCRIENGTHFPQTKNLEKLAQILNVQVRELFDFEHIKTKEELTEEIKHFITEANIADLEFLAKVVRGLKEHKGK